MTAIEQRARQRLAEEFEARGLVDPARELRSGDSLASMEPGFAASVATIVAALTPPEGFLLVPVEPTVAMEDAGDVASTWLTLDETKRVWAAMLAARPETKL